MALNKPGCSKDMLEENGHPLPSILEWLQIVSAEFDSILTVAQKEIQNVREEYIAKNAGDLLLENYKSSHVSERVISEYSHIIAKAVKNLEEHEVQFREELQFRFPKSTRKFSVQVRAKSPSGGSEASVAMRNEKDEFQSTNVGDTGENDVANVEDITKKIGTGTVETMETFEVLETEAAGSIRIEEPGTDGPGDNLTEGPSENETGGPLGEETTEPCDKETGCPREDPNGNEKEILCRIEEGHCNSEKEGGERNDDRERAGHNRIETANDTEAAKAKDNAISSCSSSARLIAEESPMTYRDQDVQGLVVNTGCDNNIPDLIPASDDDEVESEVSNNAEPMDNVAALEKGIVTVEGGDINSLGDEVLLPEVDPLLVPNASIATKDKEDSRESVLNDLDSPSASPPDSPDSAATIVRNSLPSPLQPQNINDDIPDDYLSAPSPAETIIFSRKKETDSNAILSGGACSKNVLQDKGKDNLDLSPKISNPIRLLEDEHMLTLNFNAMERATVDQWIARDPKLGPKGCFVRVDKLDPIILERLETVGFVKLDNSSKARHSNRNTLEAAINRLLNMKPGNTKPRTEANKSYKFGPRRSDNKADSDLDSRSSGDSDEDIQEMTPGEIGRISTLKHKHLDSLVDDSILNDDNSLSEAEAVDEETAKKILLEDESSVSDSGSKGKQTQSNDKKTSGYLPSDCRVSKDRDTDSDNSSEDFVKPITNKNGKKRRVLTDSESGEEMDEKPSVSKCHTKRERSHSDDDIEFIQKKSRKRIRRMRESDSSDTDSEAKKKPKPEILEISSDSDVEEVEIEDDTPKARKNIRKIMNPTKETKIAEEEEKQRKQRIADRQKAFNEEFVAPSSEVCKQLILDYDEAKKPLIEVDKSLVKHLKPHQVKGIRFLWDCCIETVADFKKSPENSGGGCILAHCMGLGKTLQALVLCPLNTVGNWYSELKSWLRDVEEQVYIHKLYDAKNNDHRVQALQTWKRRGGVGILHYDAFRSLVSTCEGKGKKVGVGSLMKSEIKACLLDPGPQIVICDEGHVFKNDASKLSQTISKIKCKRRVILTGTPLQNNLSEYHCMVNFVKPGLLGSKKEFANRFVNPITNGQLKDSTPRDVSLMKKRSHVLHTMLDGCVQRLDYSVLLPYLPPKYEYVVLIKLSTKQEEIYKYYLENVTENTVRTELLQAKSLFKHWSILSRVWSHPAALSLKNDRSKERSESDADSLKDFIDDGSEAESTESSDIEVIPLENCTENNGQANGESEVGNKSDLLDDPNWWRKFFSDTVYQLEFGTKMVILMEILRTCEEIGDKVLVFSQYLYSLDLIETYLENYEFESGIWRKGDHYFRIDGSTKTHDRDRNCEIFNSKRTSRAKLFLISTKAGGLGINLVGANRVVIFDASWNPSLDMQSIYRVYRFGQTKPCYVYRLVAKGTMEEKIYNRQVVKLSLAGRVVDEHQIERHFTFEDMAKMYEYDYEECRDVPTVPKDRLLADLLISHKAKIHSYFEHDSLLENKEDQSLTEDERRLAWEEYENEKTQKRAPLPTSKEPWNEEVYRMFVRNRCPNEPSAFYDFCAQQWKEAVDRLKGLYTTKHYAQHSNDTQRSMRAEQEVQLMKSTIIQLRDNPHLLKNSFVSHHFPPPYGSSSSATANSFNLNNQAFASTSQARSLPRLNTRIFEDANSSDWPRVDRLAARNPPARSSDQTRSTYIGSIPTKTVPYDPGNLD